MKITVYTITGKSVEITADSVSELQTSIASQMGIPIEEQKLLSNGKLLSDENLSSTVQLIISLEGGAKGKKKKQATKKTKKKHVHKKEKLRILKCYKVDGEKVVRLRRMCEVCPPGTFLAEHDDRLYCGRCRTTYAKLADKAKVILKKRIKRVWCAAAAGWTLFFVSVPIYGYLWRFAEGGRTGVLLHGHRR